MPRTGEAQFHLASRPAQRSFVVPNQILHVAKSAPLETDLALAHSRRDQLQNPLKINRSYHRSAAFIPLRYTLPKGRRRKLMFAPIKVGIQNAQLGEVERCDKQIGSYQYHGSLGRKRVLGSGEFVDVEYPEWRLRLIPTILHH